MRRIGRDHEQHQIQRRFVPGYLRHLHVRAVNWVERAPEDTMRMNSLLPFLLYSAYHVFLPLAEGFATTR
jgi:hypothetical protein